MKVIKKELKSNYCGKTLVGHDTIYIVDQLPKEGEYIEVDKKKGYVVSNSYSDEDQFYTIYLEKHLGDWDNQIIDICDAINVNIQ